MNSKFDIRVMNFKDSDLYVNTTGFAFLKFWSDNSIKTFIPNKYGYIFVKGKKINFKRLLYKAIYPNIDLKNKVVVKIGKTFNINCLYLLSKNEFRSFLKYKKKGLIIIKDNVGKCKLLPMGRRFL